MQEITKTEILSKFNELLDLLQAKVDEIRAKKDLSKQDELKAYAIEHAMINVEMKRNYVKNELM